MIGRLDVWFPSLLNCDVQGKGVGAVRTMTSAGGGQFVDRIIAVDCDNRRITYDRIKSPFPVSSYTGNVEVFTSFDGLGVLVWTVDFESTPEDAPIVHRRLEAAISAGVEGMSDELAAC